MYSKIEPLYILSNAHLVMKKFPICCYFSHQLTWFCSFTLMCWLFGPLIDCRWFHIWNGFINVNSNYRCFFKIFFSKYILLNSYATNKIAHLIRKWKQSQKKDWIMVTESNYSTHSAEGAVLIFVECSGRHSCISVMYIHGRCLGLIF